MAHAHLAQLLCLLLVLPATVIAQNATKPTNAEEDRVRAMINEAKKEAEQFFKAGGDTTDPKHPNLKWAKTLWTYRIKHPGTPASTLATVESLRLLNRSDRVTELQAKTDTLKLSDPAWRQTLYILLGAAQRKKDYRYFFNKAEAVAERATDPEIRARARFVIGDGYWRKGELEQAKVAFRTVVTQFPKTSYADEAEGNLREIEFLNIGQLAPSVERKTLDGNPFSLASFKGQVVVLKFWGTY